MPDDAASIAAALGSTLVDSKPVGGGCIHDTCCLSLADGRRVFVKRAGRPMAAVLSAEARGIKWIGNHIRTPRFLGDGTADDGSRWLALEWLDMRPLTSAGWLDFGRRLAALHAVRSSCHGLDHDNFIGSTPQVNTPAGDWLTFYQECRLRPQLEAARKRGHDLPLSPVLDAAARMLAGHNPSPALLHGDLWSGNVASLTDGSAVVFDPAPYFGDPEADLAMLELFGGPLPDLFLAGYGPLSEGRVRRRSVYDLYHALNHLNLFGAGYVSMVRRCVEEMGCRF